MHLTSFFNEINFVDSQDPNLSSYCDCLMEKFQWTSNLWEDFSSSWLIAGSSPHSMNVLCLFLRMKCRHALALHWPVVLVSHVIHEQVCSWLFLLTPLKHDLKTELHIAQEPLFIHLHVNNYSYSKLKSHNFAFNLRLTLALLWKVPAADITKQTEFPVNRMHFYIIEILSVTTCTRINY